MVKSVLSINQNGLRDWFLQRLTAVILAVYSIGLVFYFLTHSNLNYMQWHLLFTCPWMKVATILFVTALLFHAWIGMWTIFTDYLKPFWIRLAAYVLVLLGLFACFFWALQILWGFN